MNITSPIKYEIKLSDMTEDMKYEVKRAIEEAMENCTSDGEMATLLKTKFREKYNGTWHCIIGRNFGSFVTAETKHYIYLYVG